MMEASGFLDQLETQIVSLKDQMTRLQKARPVEEMTVFFLSCGINITVL